MKFFYRILFLIVYSFSVCQLVEAHSDKNKIYAFAYGTCFNDSTIYLSSVSNLSIATIDKKSKLLNDRTGYSQQFKDYLDKNYQGPHTCTIFYSTNRKKLEKKYMKVRRSCRKDKESKVVEIASSVFTLE